ncbi:MAG: hypothetical protein HY343_08275 [Lentisphaerae bacterium]|nr:hypothetical protein [Lentisphaerota bacterium]
MNRQFALWRRRAAVACRRGAPAAFSGQDTRRGSRNGTILIVVLALAAVAAMIAVGLYSYTGTTIKSSAKSAQSEQSFYIAEAGIERAKAALMTSQNGLNDELLGADGVPNTADDGILSFGSTVNLGSGSHTGTFRVKIADDNDGDSNLYADLNNTVIVTSTGLYSGIARVIEVTVSNQSAKIVPPNVDGAFAVYGTNATVELGGDALIDGDDHDLPAAFNCSGAGCVGAENTNDATAGLHFNTNANLTTTSAGPHHPVLDGDPPVETNAGIYTATDWISFGQNCIADADIIYSGGVFAGNVSIGSRADPQIVYVVAPTHFSGNVDGAGILVASADLTFTGTFHWEGIVLFLGDNAVDADLEFRESGSTYLYGAVIVVGANGDIDVGGSALVTYSSDALNNLANLGVFQPQIDARSWRTIKPVEW